MSKKKLGILVIHGFSSKTAGYKRLTDKIETLNLPWDLPTLRGHDTTPEELNGIHWREWVEDGEKALNTLLEKVEKVIVIGHSMGGWIAMQLSLTHKDDIDSVIIAGSSTRIVSPFGPGNPLHFLAPLMVVVKSKWEMLPVFADPEFMVYGYGYDWVPTKTWFNVFDFMKTMEKDLPKVTVPILILHSRSDTMNSPKGAELLYNRISTPEGQTRLVWFERTDHDMFNDCEWEAVMDTIGNYIEERLA